MTSDDDRLARVGLSRLGEPGAPRLGRAVEKLGPVAVFEGIRDGSLPLERLGDYRVRLDSADPEADLDRCTRVGGRVVCPGDPEWPPQLDDLGDVRPLLLWVRGPISPREVTERSVAVVGSRAATAYGVHVASEMGASLADRGVTVVSGAAFGIDGAAHRGALAAGGTTVAVLACGIDVAYPRGHERLLSRIADEGLVVSEVPPGCAPTRGRFLVRNRVIAALGAGTVVVEAGLRSGASSTAERAGDLGRVVMAVPGPVTSAMSAGSHRLLRDGAVLVTDATEVLEAVGALGHDLAPSPRGPDTPRDHLDPRCARVLDAVPVREGVGVSNIARTAGIDVGSVMRCLAVLAGLGHVEAHGRGWRLARALRPDEPARPVGACPPTADPRS